ncbi:hypothetical protein GJ496_003555 [Pomphorhynchus laevis]|nr:hypothetical protein GJ496_003555 [Pomphorhynchus laevis]
MNNLTISPIYASIFTKEKNAIEKHFNVTICVVSAPDGSLTLRLIGDSDKCDKVKKILQALTNRTFSYSHHGIIKELDRWRLMKSFDVYVCNITRNETFEIYAEDSSVLPKAKDQALPNLIECITLDDSHSDINTHVEHSLNADDSILFLGSFPGQPAKRKKRKSVHEIPRTEVCNSLGLPYNQSEYTSIGRHPVPIAIDGSNVAREHGKSDNSFSCRGIKIAVDFFIALGHFPVRAFVPRYIKEKSTTGGVTVKNPEILDELVKQCRLTLTPSSEELNGKLTVPYDDR